MGLFTLIKFTILPVSSQHLILERLSAVVVTIIDLKHVLIIN